jgi:hypothetical protein
MYCLHPLVVYRGFHVCNLCRAAPVKPLVVENQGRRISLGASEIRVGARTGTIFAAPDLIYHYVREHGYLPPTEFVRAVEEEPLPGSAEYAERLNNSGLELYHFGPLEEKPESDATHRSE